MLVLMKAIKSLTLLACALLSLSASAALDTNRIEQITGLKGTWNAAEGVFKVTSPRNDVKVSVDGWKPFILLDTIPYRVR